MHAHKPKRYGRASEGKIFGNPRRNLHVAVKLWEHLLIGPPAHAPIYLYYNVVCVCHSLWRSTIKIQDRCAQLNWIDADRHLRLLPNPLMNSQPAAHTHTQVCSFCTNTSTHTLLYNLTRCWMDGCTCYSWRWTAGLVFECTYFAAAPRAIYSHRVGWFCFLCVSDIFASAATIKWRVCVMSANWARFCPNFSRD